jgi:biopolymer transport protein ExbD
MATATKQRVLDVWILESNTVYRQVPFTVVTDWLQQGRLLAEDRVRPVGKEAWYPIGKVAALAAFLPRAEPQSVEDQAEALAPVELEVQLPKTVEAEDDEVDMIPLIDVSLVLLIFFVMTAAVQTGMISPINTPRVKYLHNNADKDTLWVELNVHKDRNGQVQMKGGHPVPWFASGKETTRFVDSSPDVGKVLADLRQRVQKLEGEQRVCLRADRTIPIEEITGMTRQIQAVQHEINAERSKNGRRQLILVITGEVAVVQ